MKAIVVLSILVCFFFGCASTVNIPTPSKTPAYPDLEEDVLIQTGIRYHDKGDYDEAIKIFSEILESNPDNVVALYEVSLSYYSKGEYNKSIEYGLRGLEYDSEITDLFYVTVANSYDHLDEPDKAIQVYKKGIDFHPNSYLLHYNLAVTYNRLNKPEESEQSLIRTIKLNKNHPSSHIGLAELYLQQGKQIPALLFACRFLILEPSSKRSLLAIQYIDESINWGVNMTGESKIDINIFSLMSDSSPYMTLELGLKMRRAVSLVDKEKNPVQARVEDLESLFTMISELEIESDHDFTAEYLLPYFSTLSTNGFSEVFAYYIHQAADHNEINQWLADNQNMVDQLLEWNISMK